MYKAQSRDCAPPSDGTHQLGGGVTFKDLDVSRGHRPELQTIRPAGFSGSAPRWKSRCDEPSVRSPYLLLSELLTRDIRETAIGRSGH